MQYLTSKYISQSIPLSASPGSYISKSTLPLTGPNWGPDKHLIIATASWKLPAYRGRSVYCIWRIYTTTTLENLWRAHKKPSSMRFDQIQYVDGLSSSLGGGALILVF